MATPRSITTKIILKGVDGLSGPVASGVGKSIKSLTTLQNRMRANAYASFQVGQTMAAITAGIALPLVVATKKAIDFEEAMAGVSKVTDIAVGSKGFKRLSSEVLDLSVYLGKSAVDAAGLYESLAQGGVPVDKLAEIAKLAGQVSVAFGIAPEAAGKAFSRIQTVMKLTVAETRLAADAINRISDKTNAEAPELLEFLDSGGAGVANRLNVLTKDMTAFGAALRIGVVESASEAATVMERLGIGITKHPALRKLFESSGSGSKGIIAVLDKMNSLKKNNPMVFFKAFGLYGSKVEQLAKSMRDKGGLMEILGLVADPKDFDGSILGEFNNFMSTTAAKLRVEWARFSKALIRFGESALPIIKDFLKAAAPVVETISDWVKENPKFASTIFKATAGLAALSAVVTATAFALGGFFTITRGVLAVMGFFGAGSALTAMTTGFAALTGVTLAAGVSLWPVVAAIAAIGYIAYSTNEDMDGLYNSMVRIIFAFKNFSKYAGPAWQALKAGKFDEFMAISDKADLDSEREKNRYIYGDQIGDIDARRAGRGYGKLAPVPGATTKNDSTMTFAPIYNINGSADAAALQKAASDAQREFESRMKQYEYNKNRRSF